jgi:tetratricopeptide (TPR) repeat protein
MSLPLDRPIYSVSSAALAVCLAIGFAHSALGSPQETGAATGAVHGLASPPAPAPKTLSGADSKRVHELTEAIGALRREGKFVEAIEQARQAGAICEKALGADHWQTADWRRYVETLRTIAALPAEGRLALASVLALDAAGDAAYREANYGEAANLRRRALEVSRHWLGERHPDAALSYNNLAHVLRARGDLPGSEEMFRKALAINLETLGVCHPHTAASVSNLAIVLRARGDLPGAEDMHRKALVIYLAVLGERHPATLTSYSSLALVLHDRGDLAGAEAMLRRALAIQIEVLGERHLNTSATYSNLALVLRTRGDLPGAEAICRKVLAIGLAVLGERHPDTARNYNSLATVLGDRGDQAGAEALHRKALAIQIEAFGERNPRTVQSYNNVAMVLLDRGDLPGAEAMCRKALAIQIEALGERHPETAQIYNNVAMVLLDSGDLPGAEAMCRNALAIQIEALGERNPHTAQSYNNLATVLHARGDLPGAEAMHRKALAIQIEALGERNRDTAGTYHNLAFVLHYRGNLASAEAMARKALAIHLAVLGERHPDTVMSYTRLGYVLAGLGRSAEAIDALEKAVRASTEVRKRSRGLEDAAAGHSDPFPILAALLARAGRPGDAWNRWERGLSRALLDEVAGRAARLLTDEERQHEAVMLGQAQAGDERIRRLLAKGKPTPEVEKQLDALRTEGNGVRGRLLELQDQLERKYGPLAGQPATLEAVRVTLDDATALVGWVDTDRYHWACIVRRPGDPIWVELRGSGKDMSWTNDDESLAFRLYAALASRSGGDWRTLAGALANQRLAPLEPHLKGVKRVILVHSLWLAGLPVEVLFGALAQAGSPARIVSNAPSASMFAYLAGMKPAQPRHDTLLAIGDPAYPEQKSEPVLPPPPSCGLLVVGVDPEGNAGSRGVRGGDVLLAYDGVPLKTRADAKLAPADGPSRRIPLRLWRSGQEQTVEVAAGPLGIAYDRRPAAEVVLAQRAADEVLRGTRAGTFARLPGTRREVEAVAGLFPDGHATTLLGDQARESVVQEMARSGTLKGFRYLHFATHGRNDRGSAYRTALLLAPDPDGSADPLAVDSDGEITAEQIARTWTLDAELVVLSACETALGKQAGGEGFLGFAQPLFAKGARSLVLSLWRVEDKATSLLMERFYQNLLGKRPGLHRPMPKAEALHEAKEWLRNLTQNEVDSKLATIDRGPERPLVKPNGPANAAATPTSKPAGVRPFAHPYYWAAFILIGDPN